MNYQVLFFVLLRHFKQYCENIITIIIMVRNMLFERPTGIVLQTCFGDLLVKFVLAKSSIQIPVTYRMEPNTISYNVFLKI